VLEEEVAEQMIVYQTKTQTLLKQHSHRVVDSCLGILERLMRSLKHQGLKPIEA